VLGLAAAPEGLDDDHAAAAARAWVRQHPRFDDRCLGGLGLFWARRHGEQLGLAPVSCTGEVLGSGYLS
jgi:hypothetical protein